MRSSALQSNYLYTRRELTTLTHSVLYIYIYIYICGGWKLVPVRCMHNRTSLKLTRR